MRGIGPHDVTAAASSAAPVGVHISRGDGPAKHGAPAARSTSSVAGAGIGTRP